jgi:hypothetical protein
MKRTDRKGSDWKQYERIDPPTVGVRVEVAGKGAGVVCDWPTMAVSTVRLDGGEVVTVAHESVKVIG